MFGIPASHQRTCHGDLVRKISLVEKNWMLVTDKKTYLKRMLRYINVTVTLLNMLIDLGEDISSFSGDTVLAIDNAGIIPEERIWYKPVLEGAPKGTFRN